MNVATGSGDSNITIWRDTTEEKTIKKAEEEEKRIEDEQLLSNLLLKGKYKKALGLAIRLDQPFRALSIIKGRCQCFPSMILLKFCSFLVLNFGEEMLLWSI